MTVLWWDDESEMELAQLEAEIRRADAVEPVSPEAGERLAGYRARLEHVAERLRGRKEARS